MSRYTEALKFEKEFQELEHRAKDRFEVLKKEIHDFQKPWEDVEAFSILVIALLTYKRVYPHFLIMDTFPSLTKKMEIRDPIFHIVPQKGGIWKTCGKSDPQAFFFLLILGFYNKTENKVLSVTKNEKGKSESFALTCLEEIVNWFNLHFKAGIN